MNTQATLGSGRSWLGVVTSILICASCVGLAFWLPKITARAWLSGTALDITVAVLLYLLLAAFAFWLVVASVELTRSARQQWKLRRPRQDD